MRAFFLGIDVNRASADPSLHFDPSSHHYHGSMHLDETAQNIAGFVAEIRPHTPIAWAMQNKDTRPGHEHDYSAEERAFHHVLPDENRDTFMSKTRMSPYPENREFFEDMKRQGYDTVVLAGFYASECIYWTMQDLVEAGFRVVVPTDLIAHMERSHPMHGFEDFMQDVYYNRVIFTDVQAAEYFLKCDEDQRNLPPARYTWDDMNSMYFVPGS